MLETLNFVKGSVPKKSYLPVLTSFNIEQGTIKGANGSLCLCAPIDLNLNVKPVAGEFIKAISSCKETISFHMTDANNLSIKSGPFESFVNCIVEDFPRFHPEGAMLELTVPLLPGLKKLEQFVSEDENRMWANGVLFKDFSMFATNGVVIIEYWLGQQLYDVPMNIPKFTIQELIRINEEPTHIQLSNSSVTFHFEGKRWLRSVLYALDWADVKTVLDTAVKPTAAVPDEFFDIIKELKKFKDESDRIFITNKKLSTSLIKNVGTSIELKNKLLNKDHIACFDINHLLSIKEVSTKINLKSYPSPCSFRGDDNIRGVIAPMRFNNE